jgi:predicted O-methyltransferase YrrM
MSYSERVVLYSTVLGLRPTRSLEIGTHRGGSASIIVAALDDVGSGTLVCVDPNPLVVPELWAQLAHRASLIAGSSPDVLPEALKAAGGRFDFALIDGDHEEDGVVRDIEGVLPLLADEAHLLFHDAHLTTVEAGINRMLTQYRKHLVDGGMLSSERTPDERPGICWGGLRMLRFSRREPSYLRSSWTGRLRTKRLQLLR